MQTIQLLTAAETAAALAISKATLWRRVRDVGFPQPIKIGGATRWRAGDLLDYINQISAAVLAEKGGAE